MSALKKHVLVLNRDWAALTVQTVRDSIMQLCKGRATVIDPSDYAQYAWEDWIAIAPQEGEDYVQCIGFKLRVPEVVHLTEYDKSPVREVTLTRRNLWSRDKGVCQYCHKQPRKDEITIDHVIPKSKGGQHCWENVVLACTQCNFDKADRTPKQAGMTLKKKPVKPKWRPLYANRDILLDSWEKFIGEMYWNIKLQG